MFSSHKAKKAPIAGATHCPCVVLSIGTILSEDDLTIVDTQKQLVEYLQFKDIKNDTFNTYDDDFFVGKSLIIFTNYEESSENESIISSYIIESNVITINVKTIKESDNGMMSYGYFILELSKDEIKCINEVNIVKNGKSLNIGRT